MTSLVWRISRLGLALALVGCAAISLGTASPAMAAVSPQKLTISGAPWSQTDRKPVQLDADLYLPATVPAPAVVLAHGFGGSKQSVRDEAEYLVERGFTVLAYSARGFGESTGLISMNSPEFEVADARAVIDFLASQESVRLDGPGDPRVGIAGGSYGGALALLTAGYDARIDAVAADITWNNLESSLFAQSAIDSDDVGVLKQLWTSVFFSAGLTTRDGSVTTCGRFAPQWCALYVTATTTGIPTVEGRSLMRRSSPVSITNRITAPTLLGGGEADSLFPLDQVSATSEQVTAAHPTTPVKVVWHAGGHDGGVNETDRLRALTADWFTHYLADGPAVPTQWEVSLVEGSALNSRAGGTVEVLAAPTPAGVNGKPQVAVSLMGSEQQVLAPAGGQPPAVSSLPGAGGLAGLASGLLAVALPNQSASWVSEPLAAPLRITGSTTVRLSVSAATEVRDVALFASLRTITASGRSSLPNGLVAPIRLEALGPAPVEIDVQLPAIVTDVPAGDRLSVVVATTDLAYRVRQEPAVYTINLASPQVLVPSPALTSVSSEAPAWAWPLGAAAVVIIVWLVARLLRPRHTSDDVRPDLADVPLATEGLGKRYRGGLTAVDDLTITVPRGVVVGLLGPNGAGKTTTMRMAMGLISPTSGAAYIFGHRTDAGSPVLARVGCFVEGPGFLPHLTGRQNLDLFWRASGRSGDSRLNEVLDIAGLGSAIDRTVRTYSQGMRQRLGIAQAMLGMPELLMLDEPTNGLDPPQIREMREVVRAYAQHGRTVIVSSHLLSEVEQTCSHVVIMQAGRLVASGTVTELLAGHQNLEDVFLELVGDGHVVGEGRSSGRERQVRS